MARPIKETPILKGKDAINFFKEMEKAESQKVDQATKERMKEAFEKLNSIAKF